MNRSYDEYNYTLSKRELEELKFLFISDDVDYNDTDSNGLTFLLTAIESADFVEQDGVLKPDKRSVDFIKWLIAQGSDVNFPADKKPLQYAIKCEEEISRRKGKACDMSEILLLLRESGADSTGLDDAYDRRILRSCEALRYDMREFIINQNDAGQRVDKFLTKAVPKLPKNLLYKYLRLKRIKVNGKRCEISTRLACGDVMQLYINDEFFEGEVADRPAFLSAPTSLNIIYEDENIILCDKKCGLVGT